jgi:FAD/FMN-containing dehydrogenases
MKAFNPSLFCKKKPTLINHFGSHARPLSYPCIINAFKTECPTIAVHESKPQGIPDPPGLISRIKPYNVPYQPIPNPIICCDCKTEADVKRLIKWAKKYHGIIIPIGGNTNLVEASTYRESANIQPERPIIYVRFNQQSLSICPQSHDVTCGPMVPLGALHTFLMQHNRRWDVNFSAQSATMGGIVSTNAGGEYAKAASQVAHVEMVCGDGKTHQFQSQRSQTDSVFPYIGNGHPRTHWTDNRHYNKHKAKVATYLFRHD